MIINICEKYKRKFNVSVEEIHSCIEYYKSKFQNLIFNYSKDYGPITKILGLYNYSGIDDEDVILVVDDDYKQNHNMTFYYNYCYQLYNCDSVAVDFNKIYEQQLFNKDNTNILFYDNYNGFIYGYLSFSFKFKYIKKLYEFYNEIITYDDFLFYHDDLILSLFYKKYNIYTCGINLYFREKYHKKLAENEIPLDDNNGLRYEENNIVIKRSEIEDKMLSIFKFKYNKINNHVIFFENIEQNFEIQKKIKERNLLFCCDNIEIITENYDFYKYHIEVKYFDVNKIIITITNFYDKNYESLYFDIKFGDSIIRYIVIHDNKYLSKKISYVLDLCLEKINNNVMWNEKKIFTTHY